MPASLKELIDTRNKKVHDARAVLERPDPAASDKLHADTLLDEAAAIDTQISDLQKDAGRKDRLAALSARMEEVPAGRPAHPGDGRRDRREPAAAQDVMLQWHGREVCLRAGSPEHERHGDAYRRAFAGYLAHGARSIGEESLSLQVSKDNKGGFLAPVTMSLMLIKFLDDMVTMRQLATVLPPLASAVSLGVASWDADPGDADWTPEVPSSDISDDDSASVGKRELSPWLLTKLIKISLKMLRSSVLNIEELAAQRLAYKFSLAENKAFLTGNGSKRPLGVFVASSDGISTGRDVACASTTAFTADEVINLKYSLKPQYQKRAQLLCHREWVKRARKLKDGEGQYLWQAGLSGTPDTIVDCPVVQDENAPSTFTTGQYVALLGDFKTGYLIVDSLELEVQRLIELYAGRNQIGLLGRKETDGQPVLEECFARMKLA